MGFKDINFDAISINIKLIILKLFLNIFVFWIYIKIILNLFIINYLVDTQIYKNTYLFIFI